MPRCLSARFLRRPGRGLTAGTSRRRVAPGRPCRRPSLASLNAPITGAMGCAGPRPGLSPRKVRGAVLCLFKAADHGGTFLNINSIRASRPRPLPNLRRRCELLGAHESSVVVPRCCFAFAFRHLRVITIGRAARQPAVCLSVCQHPALPACQHPLTDVRLCFRKWRRDGAVRTAGAA